jgi:predicted nucleic acid-binding protein
MTLYLDTSSLAKLYVEEPGSDEVRQDLSAASTGATSLLTYAEARAAFARAHRSGNITPTGFRSAKRDFDADWSMLVIVPPSDTICRNAGELAERYGLRGFDSIHLATFLHLANSDRSEVRFSSFDRQLNRAATRALRAARRSGARVRR